MAEDRTFVANGETARVVEIHPNYVVALLSNPDRLVRIPKSGSTTESNDNSDEDENDGCYSGWQLAYAITVHKAQGSEYPVVLWGLDDSGGAMRLGCRELFYTGLSRAKFFTKHFGKKSTADAMCARRSIMKRKTFLKELIQGTVK